MSVAALDGQGVIKDVDNSHLPRDLSRCCSPKVLTRSERRRMRPMLHLPIGPGRAASIVYTKSSLSESAGAYGAQEISHKEIRCKTVAAEREITGILTKIFTAFHYKVASS